MACGPFFWRAGAVGMYLDAGAVDAEAIDGDADHMVLLQGCEQAVEHPGLGPSPHPQFEIRTFPR